MSLLVTGVCVLGGVLIGRWVAGRRGAPPALPAPPDAVLVEEGSLEKKASGATKKDALASTQESMTRGPNGKRDVANPARSARKEHDWSDFPCALGDVVSRLGTDERWLAGVIVFSEDRPAAALFIAPEAGGDRAIFARPKPIDELLWLEPIPRDALLVGAEPPTSLEVFGLRYERTRRLPLRAERAGAGAPDVGDTVILAEYTSSGDERLVLVTGGGSSRAWRGSAIGPGMYDVMASGKSTLDEA